jgi:Crp-like helix-turn-helix domain
MWARFQISQIVRNISDVDDGLTQERLAALMGMRRESVTEAAGRLQIDGCLRYHRGHIAVVDRTGLETHACECYEAVKRETDRLLAITHRHTHMTATLAAPDHVRSGRAARTAADLSTVCA